MDGWASRVPELAGFVTLGRTHFQNQNADDVDQEDHVSLTMIEVGTLVAAYTESIHIVRLVFSCSRLTSNNEEGRTIGLPIIKI